MRRISVGSAALAVCLCVLHARAAVPTVNESARGIPLAYDVDVVVVGGSSAGVAAAVEAAKQGRDLVFRGAPCLIVGHAPDSVHYPEANAMLALHNATLMAQALGLGGFLVGYVVGACERDRRIPQLLDLPKGHRVRGALALGYPAVTFDRWTKRRPPLVRWL